MYKAIGADPTGKFVFKDITESELDDMTGADDNIAYLDPENYNKLKYAVREEIRAQASELRAHLESLADAGRDLLDDENGVDRRDWEYFETELIRVEDFLEKL